MRKILLSAMCALLLSSCVTEEGARKQAARQGELDGLQWTGSFYLSQAKGTKAEQIGTFGSRRECMREAEKHIIDSRGEEGLIEAQFTAYWGVASDGDAVFAPIRNGAMALANDVVGPDLFPYWLLEKPSQETIDAQGIGWSDFGLYGMGADAPALKLDVDQGNETVKDLSDRKLYVLLEAIDLSDKKPVDRERLDAIKAKGSYEAYVDFYDGVDPFQFQLREAQKSMGLEQSTLEAQKAAVRSQKVPGKAKEKKRAKSREGLYFDVNRYDGEKIYLIDMLEFAFRTFGEAGSYHIKKATGSYDYKITPSDRQQPDKYIRATLAIVNPDPKADSMDGVKNQRSEQLRRRLRQMKLEDSAYSCSV